MDGCVMRFGQVEFDAERGRLVVSGRSVQLDRSCAAILSALIHADGQVVDKDRLLDAGWPGRVVHENSLAKAIARLRRALGEDGRALETAHGYGYRLIACARDSALPEAHGAVAPRPARARVVVAATLGLAAVAVLGQQALSDRIDSAVERPLIKGEPADSIGRVLWVDDHPENNAKERRFLESRKIAVYPVTGGMDALALLSMYEYGAVISDMNRNDRPLAGLELIEEMRRRGDDTPFVLYTVVPSAAQREHLAVAGGQNVAVTPDQLYATVLPLFEKRR